MPQLGPAIHKRAGARHAAFARGPHFGHTRPPCGGGAARPAGFCQGFRRGTGKALSVDRQDPCRAGGGRGFPFAGRPFKNSRTDS